MNTTAERNRWVLIGRIKHVLQHDSGNATVTVSLPRAGGTPSVHLSRQLLSKLGCTPQVRHGIYVEGAYRADGGLAAQEVMLLGPRIPRLVNQQIRIGEITAVQRKNGLAWVVVIGGQKVRIPLALLRGGTDTLLRAGRRVYVRGPNHSGVLVADELLLLSPAGSCPT